MGSAAGAPTFAATPVGVVLSDSGAANSGVVGASDVSATDAYELAASWADARRFDACTVAGGSDANGDGCLDIADVQRVAGARSGSASASATDTVSESLA